MKIDTHVGSTDIKIDTKRIDKNVLEAQMLLNMQVVTDCDEFVPFQQGVLAGSVGYPQGIYGGEIEYNTPYAHYVYEGEVYGPNIPVEDQDGHITGWFSPKDKEKHPTGRKMKFSKSKHADATDHWFEKAKEQHGDEWVDLVRKTVGKG